MIRQLHPSRFRRLRLHVALVLAGALFSGCTSMQPVRRTAASPISSVIHVGDTVTCTLHDGSSQRFVVANLDATAIGNGERTIALADVAEIKVRRFSHAKTWTLVGTVLVIFVAGSYAAALGSLMGP